MMFNIRAEKLLLLATNKNYLNAVGLTVILANTLVLCSFYVQGI